MNSGFLGPFLAVNRQIAKKKPNEGSAGLPPAWVGGAGCCCNILLRGFSAAPNLTYCTKALSTQHLSQRDSPSARSSPAQDTRYPSNSPSGVSREALRLPDARSPRRLYPTCAINLLQGQPSSPSSEVRCFCCQTLLFAAPARAGTAPRPRLPRRFPEGTDPGAR